MKEVFGDLLARHEVSFSRQQWDVLTMHVFSVYRTKLRNIEYEELKVSHLILTRYLSLTKHEYQECSSLMVMRLQWIPQNYWIH